MDSVYPSLASAMGLYFGGGGKIPQRAGNRHGGLSVAPYNVYPTSSGWIAIMCFSDAHWRSLTHAMNQPGLLRISGSHVPSRADHIDLVDELVAAWSQLLDTQTALAKLREFKIPSAPVRDLSEVAEDRTCSSAECSSTSTIRSSVR